MAVVASKFVLLFRNNVQVNRSRSYKLVAINQYHNSNSQFFYNTTKTEATLFFQSFLGLNIHLVAQIWKHKQVMHFTNYKSKCKQQC